jgi:propionate CoA-transferase
MTVGAQYAVENRKIIVVKEGDKKKFVKRVDHITFSGDYARKMGKSVLYVTERSVFSLKRTG